MKTNMTSQPSSGEEQTPENKGSKIAHLISTAFGLGYFPLAPGTVTSLVTVLFWGLLFYLGLPSEYLFVAGILLFLIGAWACEKSKHHFDRHDPSEIVIDEVAGQTFALAFVPNELYFIVVSFVLFRALDILKPGPIGSIDKNVKSGFGIMLDDVIAGVFVIFIMQLFRYLIHWNL